MNPRSRRTLHGALALLLLIAPSLALSDEPVSEITQYGYKVTGKIPQPRENFVQGLQIVDDHLYVSTGNYGESKLLQYRLSDGKLIAGRDVDRRLFAEGLTVLEDRIYQLTWKSRLVLIYDRAKLQGLEYFRISGEGWGLTNNGSELIYSDGSYRLHYLSPTSKTISRSVSVTEAGRAVRMLNELEWVDGEIWANIWQQDRIIRIDPETGKVTGNINLAGLLPSAERIPGTDVLNGIAVNPRDNTIWVTGKRWPWIYQIELVPQGIEPELSQAPAPNSM